MMPRNQIIAQTTYQQVAKLEEGGDETLNKSYATIAHKLPTMILQNGLPQATGFLLSKASEDSHAKLLDHLLATFKKIDNDFDDVQNSEAFHKKIIDSDLKQIMRYTREALEISGWLRRYVQGVLKRGPSGDMQDQEEVSHD
ncbi:type III-B CRISPR module-associated protein Cmr5 [Vibrio zhugei]|uniref:CRISPR type III-B/RAMP module-associated protein Cmr5 n=1 Tax=Vibrio zhugei TaxID=2479546 RepID=A0ABV7C4D3_9VIBR|nr:type III-B CRISPR module-associated protein Cmr5 [Vibrio zhugei]